MYLKKHALFWTSVLTPVFISSNAFGFFGPEILMDVKLLLWSMALDCQSIFLRDFKCFSDSDFKILFRVAACFKIVLFSFKS